MNIFKKSFCRVYQFAFHLALPVLPYREPKKLESTDEIANELKKTEYKFSFTCNRRIFEKQRCYTKC